MRRVESAAALPNNPIMDIESCKSEEEVATEAINHVYKAQAQLAESRDSKVLLEQKESAIADTQKELTELRDKCSQLERVESENLELKEKLDQMTIKANKYDNGIKLLINRFMLEKVKHADRLEEAKAIYEDMVQRLRASDLGQLAREQVDEIIRRTEEGAEIFSGSKTT